MRRALAAMATAARRPGGAAARAVSAAAPGRGSVRAYRSTKLAAVVSSTIDRVGPVAQRWRALPTAVRDGVLAAVLAAAAFTPALASVGAQLGDLPRRPADALSVLLVLGEALPSAVRTRWPAACLAVAGTSFAVHESLGYPPSFGSLGLYLALYSAGAWHDRLRRTLAVAATAAYAVFCVVLHALGSPERLVDFALFYLALTAFFTAGAFMRRRRAEESERRGLAAREATAAERSRIARELHDVVTHHVTAMVVQADAAQFLAGAPDRVAESLTAISGTGRRALTELRYLLGVLEATGESAPAGRAPATGTLRDLVEQTRLGGQPVEFIEEGAEDGDGAKGGECREGEPPPLTIGAQLAVYRVVQEALTNAVKHAAGRRTVVRIGHGPDAVDVDIITAGAAGRAMPAAADSRSVLQPPAGRGLSGLRERVGMLGGELMAEAQPDGGFRVHARIPVETGP